MAKINLDTTESVLDLIKGCTDCMPVSFLENLYEIFYKECYSRLRKGETMMERQQLIDTYWSYVKESNCNWIYEKFTTEMLNEPDTSKAVAKKILMHISENKPQYFNKVILDKIGSVNFSEERERTIVKHFEYGWKSIRKNLDLTQGLSKKQLHDLVDYLHKLFVIKYGQNS